MADSKYLNFPVQLLQGFMVDSQRSLTDIAAYAIYAESLKLELGDELDRFKSSASHFGLTYSKDGALRAYENGLHLHSTYSEGSPHVGISIGMFEDFCFDDGKKDEFDKLCLLAYLALKSIIGRNTICKTDNEMMFSRMDGRVKRAAFESLSERFRPLVKNKDTVTYHSRKIRDELENWHVSFYSRYMRGFYFSTKLNPFDLGTEAERRRPAHKAKEKAKERKNNYEAIKQKLEDELRLPHLTAP